MLEKIKALLIPFIAMLAHEMNRAYCEAIGDPQPAWDDAPEWQQKSIIAGVEMHLANPDATPEQSHQAWLEQKLAEGWTFGEVKDIEKKEHPCCVPYEDLPPEQRAKDYIFRASVHNAMALAGYVDQLTAENVAEVIKAKLQAMGVGVNQSQAAQPSTPIKPAPAGSIPVQYIGRRDQYTDRLYGTNLTFTQGQIRALPVDLARQFLKHGDVFKEAKVEKAQAAEPQGTAPLAQIPQQPAELTPAAITQLDEETGEQQDDTAALLEQAKKESEAKALEQNQIQDLRDAVTHMQDKEAVHHFAYTKYQQKINKSKSLENMKAEALQFIDQFGAV